MLTSASSFQSLSFAPHLVPSKSALATAPGFTTLELLAVMSILAILAAMAAPSFVPMIERWRVRQATDSIVSTLYFARSEAIRQGGLIGIQKTANNTNGCSLAKTNQEWGCGWFVFHDTNNNGKWNAKEPVLHTVNLPANTNVIHQSGGTNIKVDRYGKMSGMNAKGFVISPEPSGISSPATRGVCMAVGGRIRVIEDVPCS